MDHIKEEKYDVVIFILVNLDTSIVLTDTARCCFSMNVVEYTISILNSEEGLRIGDEGC